MQQLRKRVRRLDQLLVLHIRADDNSAWVQIIVQRFRFAQKFRAEQDVFAAVFFSDRCGKTDRNRGFYDHDGVRVGLHDEPDDRLDRRGVEEIFLAVVVRGRSDDDKFCVPICRLRV